jgi:glucose-6-phosphate isomerase
LRLARETGDLAEMKEVADALRAACSDVAILGTGGSSLAAQALCALAKNGNSAPKLHFPDNLSPHGMTALLEGLPAATSHFLVVSKSGGTPETMAQFLTCHRHWQEAHSDEDLASRFTVITEPGDRPLRRMAETLGCRILDHPTDIGGRFSAFSSVALLPALIAGLDAGRVREGAASLLDQAQGAKGVDILAVPAVASVALHHHAQTRLGANITVLMAYANQLHHFTRWQQQLWAESMGKDGQGITPVGAIGPVDQHSQLQLYLNGPADKIFTILHEDIADLGPKIEKHDLFDAEIDYLCGHSIGDLVAAQTRATIETLVTHGRPLRVLHTARFDEFSLGALMMQFMLETEIWARLMGVNAYDQPAVEEGKHLARQYLSGADSR